MAAKQKIKDRNLRKPSVKSIPHPQPRIPSSVRTSPQRVKLEVGWCKETAKCSLHHRLISGFDLAAWGEIILFTGTHELLRIVMAIKETAQF
jgi:hypothetical protein